MLWSTKDPRSNLRTALDTIRLKYPSIDEELLREGIDSLNLKASSDLQEFKEAIHDKRWQKAIELYEGPFLEGLSFREANDVGIASFLDWLNDERENLEASYKTALKHALEEAYIEQDALRLIGYWYRFFKEELAHELNDKVFVNLLALAEPRHEIIQALEAYTDALEIAKLSLPTTLLKQMEELKKQTKAVSPTAKAFVGRKNEFSSLEQSFKTHALLSLIGLGGVGKTSFALEFALRYFPSNYTFIDLSVIRSADNVVFAIAEQLQVNLSELGPKKAVFDHLRHQDNLLILDNFEHVLEARDFVLELRRQCPNLRILITSRVLLEFDEPWAKEHILEGLPYPPTMNDENYLAFDAIQLFLKVARPYSPKLSAKLQTSDQERGYLLAICQRLQGLPLGLELCATWMDTYQLKDIHHALSKKLQLINLNEESNLPERQRNLLAVFEYSWELLSDDLKIALSQLSLFKGATDAQSIEAITQIDQNLLRKLVKKCLVRRDEFSQVQGLFSLHDVIQRGAYQKLTAQKALHQQSQASYIDYYLDYINHFNPQEILDQEKLNGFHVAWNNVQEAWQQASKLLLVAKLEKSLVPLKTFATHQGYAGSLEALFEDSLKRLTEVGQTTEFYQDLAYQHAHVLLQVDKAHQALDYFETELRATSESLRSVHLLTSSSLALRDLSRLDEARQNLATALKLCDKLNLDASQHVPVLLSLALLEDQ
ncbi:MAG: AAA family ATPase [Deinococcales bacterium]